MTDQYVKSVLQAQTEAVEPGKEEEFGVPLGQTRARRVTTFDDKVDPLYIKFLAKAIIPRPKWCPGEESFLQALI